MPQTEIQVNGMLFTAFHGCFEEEQIVGNEFRVDLTLLADTTKAQTTDCIDDTANYQQAYEIVRREMAIHSHLLEHLARRTIDALLREMPTITQATITIHKLHPPMGGRIDSVAITLSDTRHA